MDLSGFDGQKARAHAALAGGAFDDADALYEGLAEEYARHGFSDGQMAIRHNRLLAALGSADSTVATRLLGELTQQLMEAPAVSQVAREVAESLSRLFARAVPGIPHEVGEAARVVAAERVGVRRPVSPGDWRCEQLPGADAFATVPAATSAVLLAAAVRMTWGQAEAPAWLRAARSVLAPSGITGNLVSAEARARDAWRREDALGRYQAVVQALQVALMESAPRAAFWSLALTVLETGEPLPGRLDFLPGLPREVGLRARAELHGRLAAALEQVAGAERLARLHWVAARRLIDDWHARIDARAERGSGRAADVEAEAEASLLASAACRALGDLPAAIAWVERSVQRARRKALDGPVLVAEVRLCAAEMAERSGRMEAAAHHYLEAAQQALPLMVQPAPADERLAAIDARVLAGEGHLVLAAARALAGLRRTRADVPVGLEAARDAIAQARAGSRPEVVAGTQLEVELTACLEGDPTAGERALEAALRLSQPEAALLARLTLADETDSAEALVERGRAVAAGPLRQAAEAHLARTFRASGDEARADAFLRQLAEGLGEPARVSGTGRWDHLAGGLPELGLGGALEMARPATARRLLWGLRRRTALPTPAAVNQPFARRVNRALAEHLAAGAEGALALAEFLEDLEEPRPEQCPLPEARLAFAAVGEAVYGCFSRGDDAPIVRRLGVDRRALADRVARFRSLLEEGAFGAVGRAAAALGELILAPFAPQVGRADVLVVEPDGPLRALPFGALALPGGGGLLGDRSRLLIGRPGRRPGPGGGRVLRLLGDDITAAELRLVSGDGFPADLRHGVDLSPQALEGTLAGSRVVYLVGRIDQAGVALSADEAPISPEVLGEALRAVRPDAVFLAGPAVGEAGRRALVACLSGAPVVIRRRWEADPDCETAATIVRHLMDSDGIDPAEAAAAGLQAALRSGLPGWPAYEICVGVS